MTIASYTFQAPGPRNRMRSRYLGRAVVFPRIWSETQSLLQETFELFVSLPRLDSFFVRSAQMTLLMLLSRATPAWVVPSNLFTGLDSLHGNTGNERQQVVWESNSRCGLADGQDWPRRSNLTSFQHLQSGKDYSGTTLLFPVLGRNTQDDALSIL
jgi:hypothetical protein